MKVYTVFWNFVANSGTRTVQAHTESHAIRQVIGSYGPEFGQKATLCAVQGVHVFKRASGMLEPEVLGTRGCRVILGEGGAENTAILDQDFVTDEDPKVWVVIGDVRTQILAEDVTEYLPA
jgi:hypothetical protein